MKAVLVAEVAGKTLDGRLCRGVPGGRRQVATVRLHAPHGRVDRELHNVPHLLPLPTGATRSGGRYDDAGQLIMEFVSLDTTADELTKSWKAAGWEVRPSGFGDGHEFSYLCGRVRRNDLRLDADPANSLKNLMLVRSPAAADTNP